MAIPTYKALVSFFIVVIEFFLVVL